MKILVVCQYYHPENFQITPICEQLAKDGYDVTEEYHKGAMEALKIAKENNCKIAILKSKSPSCGKYCIYDGTFTRTLIEGQGILCRLLLENGIRVLDETEIEKL